MLPAFGLWAKLVRPMLKLAWLSLTNCRTTTLAAPILLAGESASPSQALVLPEIGCSVVCELPKTIIRLGGAVVRLSRSLSSAAAGSASPTRSAAAVAAGRGCRGFLSMGALGGTWVKRNWLFRDLELLRVDRDLRVDGLARLDRRGDGGGSQCVDVLDDLGAAVARSDRLDHVAGADRVEENDRAADGDLDVR